MPPLCFPPDRPDGDRCHPFPVIKLRHGPEYGCLSREDETPHRDCRVSFIQKEPAVSFSRPGVSKPPANQKLEETVLEEVNGYLIATLLVVIF